jgi:hypothetical protein
MILVHSEQELGIQEREIRNTQMRDLKILESELKKVRMAKTNPSFPALASRKESDVRLQTAAVISLTYFMTRQQI